MRFRSAIVGAVVGAAATLIAPASVAQRFRVIYNLSSDGGAGRLVQDKRGTIYGTTPSGGAYGWGSVFQLKRKKGVWSGKDIYSFADSPDGASPLEGVLIDNGVLWGTTFGGGPRGLDGTVYSLTPDGKKWSETIVHDFSEGRPESYMYRDRSTGYLYGTTSQGGDPQCQCGSVFSISQNGTLSTIYNFLGGRDGDGPLGSLHQGPKKGTLVGVTAGGGVPQNAGTVFLLTQNGASWSKSVIYTFTGERDGDFPIDISLDGAGNVFGITMHGGIKGSGVVFELKARNWDHSTLYSFTEEAGGRFPSGIQFDRSTGKIFGTLFSGGEFDLGAVFVLAPDTSGWTETVLHAFTGGSDGRLPGGSPIIDRRSGSLYGATTAGGQFGQGVVYEITL